MDILKKFQVYCSTESNYIETWTFSKPEICPNDSRHLIEHEKTKQLDSKTLYTDRAPTVYIAAKSWHDTNGYYMYQGYKCHDISYGIHVHDFTVPVKRCVYGLKLNIKNENIGDEISIIINPETLIGMTTSPYSQSTTNLHVSESIVKNVIPGFYIRSPTTNNVLVTDVDQTNNTLTIETPWGEDLASGTPLYLNMYMVKDFHLDVVNIQKVGYGTMSGKVFPRGSTIRVIYKNNTEISTPKEFTFNCEYTY